MIPLWSLTQGYGDLISCLVCVGKSMFSCLSFLHLCNCSALSAVEARAVLGPYARRAGCFPPLVENDLWVSLKWGPKSHQILTAAGVMSHLTPLKASSLLLATLLMLPCTHTLPPTFPPIKIQLKRKYFLEAFQVKIVLNFGCSSAFGSFVHLILPYCINLCIYIWSKAEREIPTFGNFPLLLFPLDCF